MLELSENAVREIKDLTDSGGLRFVAHEDANGDWHFDPSLADEPEDGDEVVERAGVKVFLDASAAEKLTYQVLEIESHGDHIHFQFVPQGDEAGDGGPDGDPAAA